MPTWRYETTNAYTQLDAHSWYIDKRGRCVFTDEHNREVAILNDWQSIVLVTAINTGNDATPTDTRPLLARAGR